jgi:hypothetical protein
MNVDLMLARAQIGLAFLFAIGFLVILGVLIFYQANLTPTVTTILTSLLSVFVTILTLQSNYFFARTRPPTLPDPANTVTVATTTSTTTPTGVPHVDPPTISPAVITPAVSVHDPITGPAHPGS